MREKVPKGRMWDSPTKMDCPIKSGNDGVGISVLASSSPPDLIGWFIFVGAQQFTPT